MDFLDEIDMNNIKEMYDNIIINRLDNENVKKIYNYLINQGMFYAKDIFIEHLELFLLDCKDFINKFEKLKKDIGENYIEKILEDSLIIEKM